MVEEPAYIRDLRLLTRSNPTVESLEELEQELYFAGSDRATAVMFGSMVEVNLERLIATKLRDDLNSKDKKLLFEFEGCFGTFSAKTVGAYALGLIGPVIRFDLDLIRLLRNEFAHSRVHFNFNTPQVKAVCDKLKIVEYGNSFIPYTYLEKISEPDLHKAIDKTNPKTRFICACHTISDRMHATRFPDRSGITFDPVLP